MRKFNLYTPETVRLWFVILNTEGYLELEDAEDDNYGKTPTWLTEGHDSIEDLVRCELISFDYVPWMLREGIAPGQPFLIEMEPTRYSGPDYNGEYDADTPCFLITKVPWSNEKSAKAWGTFLEERDALNAAVAEAERQSQKRTWENVAGMSFRFSRYFAKGQSSLDDMEMPQGILYRLEGKDPQDPHWPRPLVEGRDDTGDHQKAKEACIAKALQEHPELPVELLRSKPAYMY